MLYRPPARICLGINAVAAPSVHNVGNLAWGSLVLGISWHWPERKQRLQRWFQKACCEWKASSFPSDCLLMLTSQASKKGLSPRYTEASLCQYVCWGYLTLPWSEYEKISKCLKATGCLMHLLESQQKRKRLVEVPFSFCHTGVGAGGTQRCWIFWLTFFTTRDTEDPTALSHHRVKVFSCSRLCLGGRK